MTSSPEEISQKVRDHKLNILAVLSLAVQCSRQLTPMALGELCIDQLILPMISNNISEKEQKEALDKVVEFLKLYGYELIRKSDPGHTIVHSTDTDNKAN